MGGGRSLVPDPASQSQPPAHTPIVGRRRRASPGARRRRQRARPARRRTSARIFVFLIARLLGEAALGRFGLAFATTDLLSKAGDARLRQQHRPVPRAARRGGRPRRRAPRVSARASSLARRVVAASRWSSIPVVMWLAATRGLDAFTRGGARDAAGAARHRGRAHRDRRVARGARR